MLFYVRDGSCLIICCKSSYVEHDMEFNRFICLINQSHLKKIHFTRQSLLKQGAQFAMMINHYCYSYYSF